MRPVYFITKKTFLIVPFFLFALIGYTQDITDRSVKKNILTIDNSLEMIVKLEPKKFEFNDRDFKYLKFQKGEQYGFIAEDFQTVFPELINERAVSHMVGKNLYRNARIKTVNETALIPLLVAAVKEQQEHINKLRIEISELKKQITPLQQ